MRVTIPYAGIFCALTNPAIEELAAVSTRALIDGWMDTCKLLVLGAHSVSGARLRALLHLLAIISMHKLQHCVGAGPLPSLYDAEYAK